MKHKRNYLASFDLHIIVCLCYKMIYGRDTINRKSHLSHTTTILFFRWFTPPLFKVLKNSNKHLRRCANKFINCSNLYINSRTSFKTIRYLWLTIQDKRSPRIAIFLKKNDIFFLFYGFCHRNMMLRLTKMAKTYTITRLFFYNKHFESKNKQYACCSSLFNVHIHFH